RPSTLVTTRLWISETFELADHWKSHRKHLGKSSQGSSPQAPYRLSWGAVTKPPTGTISDTCLQNEKSGLSISTHTWTCARLSVAAVTAARRFARRWSTQSGLCRGLITHAWDCNPSPSPWSMSGTPGNTGAFSVRPE